MMKVRHFPLPKEVKQRKAMALFSDGACRGNPGPGAWGVLGQTPDEKIAFEKSQMEFETTNNQMELMGAIEGLEELIKLGQEGEEVFLYSDSKYVVNGITQWVWGWKKRGWKKSDKKTPENLSLWQKLDELRLRFPKIHFRWIKGHAGHPQNEYVDQLANNALDRAGY